MLADVYNVRAMLKEKEQKVLLRVSPGTPVILALDIMRAYKVGALLVMDQEFRGIFTERDYAWKVELHHKSAAKTNVEEVMTPADKVVSCTRFTSLEEALTLMDDNHIRHLPVIEHGKVVGIISIRDVMHGILAHQLFLTQYFMEAPGGRT